MPGRWCTVSPAPRPAGPQQLRLRRTSIPIHTTIITSTATIILQVLRSLLSRLKNSIDTSLTTAVTVSSVSIWLRARKKQRSPSFRWRLRLQRMHRSFLHPLNCYSREARGNLERLRPDRTLGRYRCSLFCVSPTGCSIRAVNRDGCSRTRATVLS